MTFYILLDQGCLDDPTECRAEHAKPLRLAPSSRLCTQCGASLEPARWEAPYRVKISGTECGDLIPGAGFEIVISREAWEHFVADGITGWTLSGTVEAKVNREYVVVRPHVSVTRLLEAQSHLEWLRPPTCESCRLGVRKRVGPIVLDPATLDGTDIFVPSGAYGLKIVSDKFRNCVEQYRLRGFRLVLSSNYSE